MAFLELIKETVGLHSHTSKQNIIKATPLNFLHCKHVNSDLKLVQLSEDYYIE